MAWANLWQGAQPEEDQEDKAAQIAASPVSWSGQFPTKRGGAVVFILTASSSFAIAVLSAADVEGAISSHPYRKEAYYLSCVRPSGSIHPSEERGLRCFCVYIAGGGGWQPKSSLITGGGTSRIPPCSERSTLCAAGETAQPWVGVRVGKERVELVYAKGDGHSHKILTASSHPGAGFGGRKSCQTCWLSFDPDKCTVKFGNGSRMLECTYLQYTFQGSGKPPPPYPTHPPTPHPPHPTPQFEPVISCLETRLF